LALSTACPIWRGYLSDIDSRWNVLSETSDDRTKEELEKKTFHSSRYSSAPCYLSESSIAYNDIDLNIDHEVYETLIKSGHSINIIYFITNDYYGFSCLDCPSTLARHFAHLFLRDPLYVTDEQVYPKNDQSAAFAFEVLFLVNRPKTNNEIKNYFYRIRILWCGIRSDLNHLFHKI
jgi:glutamate--cysteine ligase catalytic subunit